MGTTETMDNDFEVGTDRALVQAVVSKVRGALKATRIGSISERTTRNGFVLDILDTEGKPLGHFEVMAPVVKPRATKAKPALALGSGLSAAQAANLATLPAGELTLASLGLAKVRCKSVPPALASKVVWGEADGGVEGLIVAAHRPEVVAHDPEATFYPILMPPAGSGVVLGFRGPLEPCADLARSIAATLIRGEVATSTHGSVSEVTLPVCSDEVAVATAISYATAPEAGLGVTLGVRKMRKARGA